jgi:hypothetical protein
VCERGPGVYQSINFSPSLDKEFSLFGSHKFALGENGSGIPHPPQGRCFFFLGRAELGVSECLEDSATRHARSVAYLLIDVY